MFVRDVQALEHLIPYVRTGGERTRGVVIASYGLIEPKSDIAVGII